MKKSLVLLALSLMGFTTYAQVTFPYHTFNLMPVEGYYADMAMNAYWHGINGWQYFGNGPCLKLRLGEWNTSSDFVFETAPVNANGFNTPITFTEVMRIRQNGQVGIGTSYTGSHRLAVEGSIGARKVMVTKSGWADFVFSPGYQLPSLQEIEAHIKRYQHLPGIPSAQAIAAEGLDLGDMQQKQMQKIEELTLYVIELNKKLEAQQQELTELRKTLQEKAK